MIASGPLIEVALRYGLVGGGNKQGLTIVASVWVTHRRQIRFCRGWSAAYSRRRRSRASANRQASSAVDSEREIGQSPTNAWPRRDLEPWIDLPAGAIGVQNIAGAAAQGRERWGKEVFHVEVPAVHKVNVGDQAGGKSDPPPAGGLALRAARGRRGRAGIAGTGARHHRCRRRRRRLSRARPGRLRTTIRSHAASG